LVGPRRRFPLKFFLAILALAVILFFTRQAWLAGLGRELVNDQGPAKADIAVVLAGDFWGHRILKAGELVRQGYVPAALVSGPPGFYGLRETDVAIPFAVRHGYPAQYFIPVPIDGFSTKEEATAIFAELHRRNIRSFLLVTSNFHTARAARIYRAFERGNSYAPSFRTVASGDEFFRPDSWWDSRESRKIFFNEWVKTVANVLGI
jgi:uncharacterized SAM-binding protein YcdF (DUF218 family)